MQDPDPREDGTPEPMPEPEQEEPGEPQPIEEPDVSALPAERTDH